MAFTNQTTHYGLPQWIGSDKPTYLVDQNNAYQTIDSEIYNAKVAAGDAVTTANGAATTAASAAASAATAVETANTATTTAQTADTKADNATTLAQAAQTAAGAAQTAAEAAQTAAAGNSITNLANAYDPTLTYDVGDLVTQDGKLYQCITAVTTPEAFDINKWDDKTTSEVYQPKLNDILYAFKTYNTYTIPAYRYSTYLDAFVWLYNHAHDVLQLENDEIAMGFSIYVQHYSRATDNYVGYYTPSSTHFDILKFSSLEIHPTEIYSFYVSLYDTNSLLLTAVDTTITDHTNDPQNYAINLSWNVYKKI